MGMCSSPKAPDYTAVANASKETAEMGLTLGREQLDFAKAQYDELKPLFQQITDAQLATQEQTAAQAKDYYDYQQKTFRPLEEKLVADATNFNTEAYREGLAQKASADAGDAFSNTQAMNARSAAAMGVNPNSGRFSGAANRNNLGLAAARAGSMNQTRQRAQDVGYARMMDATGLGRGLAGASQGAYGLAINSGNAAGSNAMAPGTQYMNGMAQGNSTIMNGQNMQLSGLSNVLGAQTSVYNSDPGLDVGSLMSGGAALMGAWPSDRRLKQDVEMVGFDASSGLALYEFAYIGEPERRYRGVMADEVLEVMPTAVVYDDRGYMAVNYGMLGIEMKEVA